MFDYIIESVNNDGVVICTVYGDVQYLTHEEFELFKTNREKIRSGKET